MSGGRADPGGTRRWRARWLLPAVGLLLVGLLGAGTFLLMHRTGITGRAAPAPSGSPRESAAAPACGVQVAESGFTDRYGLVSGRPVPASNGEINFGVVVTNPCPQAAIDTHLTAQPVDAAGAPVRYRDGTGPVAYTLTAPVIPPGRQLGLGGAFANTGQAAGGYDARTVTAIRVTVRQVDWQPAAAVSTPTPVAGQQVRLGARGPDGYTQVTFTLPPDSATQVGGQWVSIIVRDATGKILTGEPRRLPLDSSATGALQTQVWVPDGVERPRAQVYLVPDGF